jgi:hypothetical protein
MSAALLSGEAGPAAGDGAGERKTVAVEEDGKVSRRGDLRYVPGLVMRPGGNGRED